MADEDDKNGPVLPPFRSVGEVTANLVSDLRFRRRMRTIHALGERPTAELVAELIGRFCDTPAEAELILRRYAALRPEDLEVTGGDQVPPMPPPRRIK